METKFFISSSSSSSSTTTTTPPLTTHLPFFLSFKSPLLKTSVNSTSSQGHGLVSRFRDYHGRGRAPLHCVRAAVKRRKEMPFDNVIQKDKKLKFVLKVRKILVSRPDWTMPLRDLGRYRRELGLDKKRRFIALLRKFPGVFEIVEEGAYSLYFKMTPEAEALYRQELEARDGSEELLVVKLRKLLMMSLEKRISIEKISHLKNDLGLPIDFAKTICHDYPQFFKVVPTGRGPALELTHWDPELAISAAELAEEENRIREIEEKDLIIDRPLKFNRVKLPRGLNLSKGEMRKIVQFKELRYISPYRDFSELRLGTALKEKHACGVIHEMLSLTMEKRTLVDHLTHFREEFRFSQQLRGMLIRHPDMFYVSLKGDRDSVFLREAYHNSQLRDKNLLLVLKEKFRALVDVPKFRGKTTFKKDGDTEQRGDGDEEGSEVEENWSDLDSFVSDDDSDDDNDIGDWSDDDDTPPDFDDDDGTVEIEVSKPVKRVNNSTTKVEKEPVTVLPDGRPRERW